MNFSNSLNKIKNFKFYPELILFFTFLLTIYKLDLSWFNSHMSRDLVRAIEWSRLHPSSWLGPEMGWDYKRLPGPSYYLILSFFWMIVHSVEGLLFCKILFTSSIVYFLIRELKKTYSILFVSFFSLQFLLTPVYIATLRNLWNPSLIVGFGCFIFLCALKYDRDQKIKWVWLSSLLAFMGMQIHFSVSIPFIAFVLALVVRKKQLKALFLIAGLFSVWLLSWLYLNPVPELQNQVSTFYGLNSFVLNRLQDLFYHLSLSLKEIGDYDLFYRLAFVGAKLELISSSFFWFLNPLTNVLYGCLFLVLIFSLFYKLIKTEFTFIQLFAFFWFFVFILSFVVTKHKPQMPYRYGLALYPIQFFLLYLSFDYVKSKFAKISKVLILFFIFVSASHLYFVLHFYELQNVLGRTHHTGNDNLEMTLKVKKYIYSLLPKIKNGEDPFTYLHGRSINKMRLKEMNWEQTSPYYGLFYSLTGKNVLFHEDLIQQAPQSSWLFQLHNTREMSLKPESPFLVTELKPEALPQSLVIKYLDSNNEGQKKLDWLNTNLILPLAFSTQAHKPALVRLEFELNTQTNKFLNLLIDDNETYGYIYKTTYKLLQVKINSKVVAPIEKYKGYFLVQNQYIYRIAEKDQNVKVVVELKVENALLPNFTRVDLFTTSSSLASEELE